MDLSMLSSGTGVSFPGLGINDLPIDRVAFTIGSFPVYWYGICIILGFGLCIVLAMLQAKRFSFKADDVIDISLVIIPAAIIGARLYYVASAWDEFASNPISIFDIRSGGLAVLGGVLLSLAAVLVLAHFKKWDAGKLFNALIVYIPLGQAIGRWGNFFNQEAFGTNTTLPWGMISPSTTMYLAQNYPELDPLAPVHPTFFYEFLACSIIFVILLIIREKSKLPFVVPAAYFILYGIARFFIEGLRTDSLYIGDTGLRTSQVLSAVMIVAGFAIIAFFRYKRGMVAEAVVADGSFADAGILSSEVASSGDASTETSSTEEISSEEEPEDSLETQEAENTTEADSDSDDSSSSETDSSESSDSSDSGSDSE